LAKSGPFAGMPFEVAISTGSNVLISLCKHPLYPLPPSDFRDLRNFTHSQQSQLLEYCLLEEALRLLRDVCRGYPSDIANMYAAILLSEKLPLRSIPAEWTSLLERFLDECRGWVAYLDLWSWNWTAEQVNQIPADGLVALDGRWRFTKQINMHWTRDLLDAWACAWNMTWDEELVGKLQHDVKDPGFVLTHIETGRKILLSCDPEFVVRMVRGTTSEWQQGATFEANSPIDTTGDSGQESGNSAKESIRVSRGRTCVQVKDEMKRIRFMTRDGGQSLKDVMAATGNFKIWEIAKSENLTQEDKETLFHPNQWGTGYSTLLLSKYFAVKAITIRDYITAYNRANPKTPRIQ
jgi:hypothetical protein